MLHGRLPAAEKDAIMRRFAAGEIDVLVATTVIEVGVDVPNATAMVVMDAERFGMSQLHQLRGRVGRGRAPGVCLLVTEADQTAAGIARLRAVAATTDGFELAEADLQLRREGDVLGTSQAGRSSTCASCPCCDDQEVIEQARDDARSWSATIPRWPASRAGRHGRRGDRRGEPGLPGEGMSMRHDQDRGRPVRRADGWPRRRRAGPGRRPSGSGRRSATRLAAGGGLDGARVLDLYAGSGALAWNCCPVRRPAAVLVEQ